MKNDSEGTTVLISDLNENYFTLKEVAEKYHCSYANLSRKSKKLKLKDYGEIFRLGNRFVIHKKDIQSLIQDERQVVNRRRSKKKD